MFSIPCRARPSVRPLTAGMAVAPYIKAAETGAADGSKVAALVKPVTLNAGGRHPDSVLMDTASLQVGPCRLVLGVTAFFTARAVTQPELAFPDGVAIDFHVADASQHNLVPLLVTPWAYSTCRGS